jgi:hypothetical protein
MKTDISKFVLMKRIWNNLQQVTNNLEMKRFLFPIAIGLLLNNHWQCVVHI